MFSVIVRGFKDELLRVVSVATCHVSGVMFIIRVGTLNSPLIIAVNAQTLTHAKVFSDTQTVHNTHRQDFTIYL